MQDQSDAQLLRDFAERADEAAFRELVTRHTDFVYSAALRQVESSAIAGDLAQSVFTDLARKAQPLAEKITGDSSLAGWLHRSTRYAALNHLRDTRRRRENERQAMEQLLTNSDSATDWEQIRPALDEALDSLADEDREALLLRYFKNHDFRAVGHALGVSDDTAQKRVSRAVEKLREFFAKKKITVGTGSLGILISANAVQAAPIGLAVTISAAALAGTTIATSSTIIAATKTIAMTTLQKTVITATVAVLAGVGIYEVRQAAQLREQNQTLQQQQTPLAEQMQKLQNSFADATNRLADLRAENSRLKSNPNQSELLKLRGEVTILRNLIPTRSGAVNQPLDTSNPLWKPNWIALRPVDLAQFPDSDVKIQVSVAKDMGISTPVALLQTWIWAQATMNAEGILKTWCFPEGTTEEQKRARILEAQQDEQWTRSNPNVGRAQTTKLRELFDLGGGDYLAFIEEKGMTTDTWVSHQFFRRIGDEWKVCLQRNAN